MKKHILGGLFLAFVGVAPAFSQSVPLGPKIGPNPTSTDGNWQAYGFRPRVVGDKCVAAQFRNVNKRQNYDGPNEWSWIARSMPDGTLCTVGIWKEMRSGSTGGGITNIFIKKNGEVFWAPNT